MRQIRQHHPRMGTRKRPSARERHCAIGRDRLFRLLSEHELLIQPKRSYRRTTYAGLYRWPNLLPALRLERVGQLWVADITYLATADGFAYLALVTDSYSRYIVGYDLCASLALEGAARPQMALDHAQHPRQGLIHHSDHGVQYTARPYTDLLQAHGLRPSMGAVATPMIMPAERVMASSSSNTYGSTVQRLAPCRADGGQASGSKPRTTPSQPRHAAPGAGTLCPSYPFLKAAVGSTHYEARC
ncbi:MAG: DDE-type integrase/transposase/recombinase [Ardenticatenales bacterium]|nr:DDE-type integrase/transposase/recombinase [Ardenticatenales bacterium]